MPIFILAFSQNHGFKLIHAIYTFLVIQLLVCPASNGYNSYLAESPIRGLENPSLPTKSLFYLTLIMNIYP